MTAWPSRDKYAGAALITICAGLLVHLSGTALNPVVRDVLGDALWAMMIAWLIGALAPRAAVALRGVVAYGVCVGVEISQTFHTPTLDAIRATTAGHLVLGSGFDPRDLVAYLLGIATAVALEEIGRRSR